VQTFTLHGACSNKQKQWVNPFLPYDEQLWVRHLSDTHTLLLNKFNVVAHHLICVTRTFQPQTDDLNAADLGATWEAMQVWNAGQVDCSSQQLVHGHVKSQAALQAWCMIVTQPESECLGYIADRTWVCQEERSAERLRVDRHTPVER
jgi:hypothetical protein